MTDQVCRLRGPAHVPGGPLEGLIPILAAVAGRQGQGEQVQGSSLDRLLERQIVTNNILSLMWQR